MNLPKHWKKLPLKKIVIIRKGKRPLKLEEKSFTESLPYLDIEALESNGVSQFADPYSSTIGTDRDILMVWDGSRSGLVALGRNGAVGSTLMCITPLVINQKFLYYFLKSNFDYFNKNTTGASIPHINQEVFDALIVPIPPVEEQEEIVIKLESRIHEYNLDFVGSEKELVNLANYKKSLLVDAITGKMTEAWRELNLETNNQKKKRSANGYEFPPEWEVVLLGDIKNFLTSGSRNWAKYYNYTGAIYIRIGNLSKNSLSLDLTNDKLIHVKLPENIEGKRTRIQIGDVLVSITGAYIGLIGYVENDIGEAYINQHVALVRVGDEFESKFLAYVLLSDYGNKQLHQKVSGATKAGLSLSDIESLKLPKPTLLEQKHIVQTIDKLLLDAEMIEKKSQESLKNIEKLQKSVLQFAFAGGLSTPKQSNTNWWKNFLSSIELQKSEFYLEVSKTRKKKSTNLVKLKKQMSTSKTILQILEDAPGQKMMVEDLWQQSSFYKNGYIEAFYEELEILIKSKSKSNKTVVAQFVDKNKSQVILKLI